MPCPAQLSPGVQHRSAKNNANPKQQRFTTKMRSQVHSNPQQKDHWTSNAYSTSASFVPQLTTEIVSWLSPEPRDTILDLGCGDGVLTARLRPRCSRIAGFDSSSNLINAAREAYGTEEALSWHVLDCRYLEGSELVKEGEYSKVFSNAALHWILRDPSTRMSVLKGVYKTLQPGGAFVFEMGGAGNVAEIHSATLAALVHQGVSIEKAREACPCFFPSEVLMRNILEEVGFRVERTKLEYRPTKLTSEKEGGLEGWMRLMAAQFLEVLDTEEKKEKVVREVCQVLHTILTHEEDGSMWLGYVRLKVMAFK